MDLYLYILIIIYMYVVETDEGFIKLPNVVLLEIKLHICYSSSPQK